MRGHKQILVTVAIPVWGSAWGCDRAARHPLYNLFGISSRNIISLLCLWVEIDIIGAMPISEHPTSACVDIKWILYIVLHSVPSSYRASIKPVCNPRDREWRTHFKYTLVSQDSAFFSLSFGGRHSRLGFSFCFVVCSSCPDSSSCGPLRMFSIRHVAMCRSKAFTEADYV